MCTADLYTYPPERRAEVCAHDRDILTAPASSHPNPSHDARDVGADHLARDAGSLAGTPPPSVPGSLPASRASITRHQREGRCLALRGGARMLREAMEAPDARVRIARWRNRYAIVPTELTLGDNA